MIVRKLKFAQPAAALVFMHFWTNFPLGEDWEPHWFDSAEVQTTSLAQYYDVSSLSMRNALLSTTLEKKNALEFVESARIHPNALGHKLMADLCVHFISLPFHRANPTNMAKPLVPGNVVGSTSLNTCRFGHAMESVVVPDSNWVFEETDPNKAGFVTNSTHANLDIRLAHIMSGEVTLFYVRSWRSETGHFQLSCKDGCTCATEVVDTRHGHETHNDHATFTVQVTGSPCTVHLEAFDKIKVTGVVTGRFAKISLQDFVTTNVRTWGGGVAA